MSPLFRVSTSLLAAALLASAGIEQASAATSQRQAQAKAVSALRVRQGTAPVIVFRQPGAVPARTAIQQAGAASARGARATAGRDRALQRAGVTVASAPQVLRTGSEPAWLFYEDQAPFQAYQHRGRVVLVGVRTGRVTVSRSLAWPPLIAGRLPAFLKGFDAYRAPRYRAFTRGWRLRAPGATARGGFVSALLRTTAADVASAVAPDDGGASAAEARAADPAAVAASKAAADQLAAERSCAIRVSDTLGDFYDVGPVDRTRAELGTVFNRLAAQNAGFSTTRYRYRAGKTPAGSVRDAVERRGCKDVLLYLGGGGYRTGAPAVNVGTRARSDGRIEQQVVTAADVRAILRAHRGVTFKLLIDAPYSGAFLPVLRGEENLELLAASSGARDGSFTALADVHDASGRPVVNAYNPRGRLEFSNRGLTGLKCFLSRGDEVDAAARAKAEGRSRSFLAWMLGRAFTLCGEGSLADQLEGAAPSPVIYVRGGLPPAPPTDPGPDVPPTPPGPTPPGPTPPPGPGNHAPVAVGGAVRTDEDTAVTIPLAGVDPDGDPLTVAIVDAPTAGTLTGTGDSRTYTPKPNAAGDDRLTFTVSDGQVTSAPATVSIRVAAVNDAPTARTSEGTATFAERGAPVAVDPAVALADVDDTSLTGATVAIGDGRSAGDELLFSTRSGITGTFDAASGTLTLRGTASVADYQAALRSVRFRTVAGNPSGAPRDVAIRVHDGDAASAPARRTVAVATINDAPVLAGGGTLAAFTEDGLTGVAVAPSVTISDVDSPTLASATVRISAGFASAEDRLLLADGDGITGRYDAATGVLTLTGAASPAAYQAALRRVQYRNVDLERPSTAPRTVELRVDDGAADDSASNAVTTGVVVTAVNDAPTVVAGGGTATFTEDGSPVAVDPALTVADVDDTHLQGATVTLGAGARPGEDVLALPATPGLAATYDAAEGTLRITGRATVAAYRDALRTVTYANTNDGDPSPARRTVVFTVSDGALTSDAARAEVGVDPVNDAPTLAGGGDTATYVEDEADGVLVGSAITVADVDSATLASATVQIATGRVAAEDRLTVVDRPGITSAFDAATGVLTLTGIATTAEYQAALRTVRYRNVNGVDPSDAPRGLRFRVHDGAATSAAIEATVLVSPRDDAPTVVGGGGTATFTEDGAPVRVDPTLGVADGDDTHLEGATVTLGAGARLSEDVLALPGTPGLTAAYSASTGTLEITGRATVAAYRDALRTVTYANTNDGAPSDALRTVSFVVTDGERTSAAADAAVAVTPVNDAPTLGGGGNTVPFDEDNATGVVVNAAITVADVDSATMASATVQIGTGFVPLEDRLTFADRDGITGSYDADTGVLTLTGSATKATYEAALRTVHYRNVNGANPDAAQRRIKFRIDDGTTTSNVSTAIVSGVDINPSNDAPTLTAGGGSPTYTEGGDPVVVDPGVTVADGDNASLTGATVAIDGGFDASDDRLLFTDTTAISGTFDDATGTLRLTGTASVAAYQAALRTVAYRNVDGDAPGSATRAVAFTVSDGELSSNVAATDVRVQPVNDAPTLAGAGTTAAYVEDDTTGEVALPGLTVADVDNAGIASATVRISSGLSAAEDRLTYADQNGIVGEYDAATGTLTLTGTATKAEYQAALRAVRYRNLNDASPSTAPRTVTAVVHDGALPSAAASGTVTVTRANDAPTVTTTAGTTPYAEDDATGVPVDPGVDVVDVDGDQLTGATVQITTNHVATEDVLVLPTTTGITGSYDGASGTLTLTGTASAAAYRDALRSVSYRNTETGVPATQQRTVRFTATDGTATSAAATKAVKVTAVNDLPVVTTSAGSAAFVEDAGPVAVDPGLTVADRDDTTLAGAVVRLEGELGVPEGELGFTSTAAITGLWNSLDGTLTLSGTASVASYEAALRSVTFDDGSDTPDTGARTVSFSVTDAAQGASAAATRGVTVAPTNDRPTVTAGGDGPASYTEGDAAVPVAPSLLVADPDSATLASATVCICGNRVSAQDALLFDGTDEITGSYDSASGILSLSGVATPAQYQAALRTVRYRNSSTQPSTNARRVDVVVVDGGGRASTAASATVAVVAVNTAPTLGGGGTTLAYAEDDPAAIINGSLTLTDPDDVDIDRATVAISSGYVPAEDRLLFTNTGTITGAFDTATGVLTLTGADTLENYRTALRSVRYRNLDVVAPTTDPRIVGFRVDDGDALSATATSTVTVSRRPDAPVVTTGTGNVRTFTEGGTAVTVDDAVGVSDVDSADLARAQVSIATGFSQTQGDTLAFANQNGITGSYDAATGVLTLTGAATPAEYTAALRSVRFSNTSDAPTTSRTVTMRVEDETSTGSNVSSHTVTIAPVNDAPRLAGGGSRSYTENDAATAISPALTLADPDNATISGATVRITGNLSAAQDRLSFASTASITGSYEEGTGTLTLSGTDTVANYEAALRAVRYANTSEAPSDAQRTVTFTATDAATPPLAGSTTATIAVVPVNDAPVATADTESTPGNTMLAYGTAAPAEQAARVRPTGTVLGNDTDVDGPGTLGVDVAASSPTTPGGGTVAWNADGSFDYVPAAGFVGDDTLTYRVADGAGATANGTVKVTVANRVWYVENDAPAGGDGRSSAPFDTLVEADAAATASTDRIYVHRGTGTTAGLTGGVSLANGQRLIGAAQDLQVGSDTLYDSTPAERPVIAGTVVLEDGNTVTGLRIDGGGGTAIQGATGDDGGTLEDLELTGAGGTGIALAGTTGTWDVGNTTVAMTAGGQGITASNAGTLRFTAAGTVAVRTANARGVTISGTATAGTIDEATVNGSPTTGVALTSTTGSLNLDAVRVSTTGTGLALDNASGVAVRSAAGTESDVVSTGTAVDVSSDAGTPTVQPTVALRQASSSGGAYGIRLSAIGNGTFAATSGTLSGHTTAELGVLGGSGNVTYGGAVGNGSGQSVRVTDRTGGAVVVSGAITDSSDAGGGIVLSNNSGGTTTFSGSAKTLDTGASNAVDLAFNGSHAVRFTGGGLDVDTTSGIGLRATTSNSSGELTVEGPGNSVTSTSGTAINVNGPDFGAADATFQSVTATGATSGVVLANTGTAGGLHVTGAPVGAPAAGSGGTVSGSTGPGLDLRETSEVQLAAFTVSGGADDGIRGAGVRGLELTGGSRVVNNGNAIGEQGLDLTELSGIATVTGATVTGNAESNMSVVNDAATLTNLVVQGGTFGSNSPTLGNDGIHLENTGSGSTTGTISGVTFTNNRSAHVQVTTDASNTATQNVAIQNNNLRGDANQPNPVTLGGGVTVNPAGASDSRVVVSDNDIERAAEPAIVVTSPAGSTANVRATIQRNTIGTAGEVDSGSMDGDGIYVHGHGNSTVTSLIQDNDIRQFSNAYGIAVLQNDGDGAVNATVRGNLISEPGSFGTGAIRLVIGSDITDNGTSCLDIGHATDVNLRNRAFGVGTTNIRLRMAGGTAGDPSVAQLAGYSGPATTPNAQPAVNAYLAARNTRDGMPTVTTTLVDANSEVASVASCPLP